jgi:NADH:ubiquinone oxidoreductase subunit D
MEHGAKAYEATDRDYPTPTNCDAMDKSMCIVEEAVESLSRQLSVILRPSVPTPTALRDEVPPDHGRSPIVLRMEKIQSRAMAVAGTVQNLTDRIDLP